MSAEAPMDMRIAVIGAGAIGCAVLPRLVRMPFAMITIVDGDRVEEKNLDRQELYAPVDIGQPKAAVTAAWLRNAPTVASIAHKDVFLDEGNAEQIISMHDVVADCTDDVHVRRLIDRICNDYGVVLVSGAVHAREGQVIALHVPGANDDMLLSHLFTGSPGGEQDGCDMRLVPSHVIEAVAQRMSWRIRELLTGAPITNGCIEQYDGDVRAWLTMDPPE